MSTDEKVALKAQLDREYEVLAEAWREAQEKGNAVAASTLDIRMAEVEARLMVLEAEIDRDIADEAAALAAQRGVWVPAQRGCA